MNSFSRRRLLSAALLGSGGLALRSIATGLSTAFLTTGRAEAAPLANQTALILATASDGDPLNIGAPGSLVDPHLLSKFNSEHVVEVQSASVDLGGRQWAAAAPWATLPAALRERLAFIHHRTFAETHPEHPKVLRIFDALRSASGNGVEMLPSAIAAELAAAGWGSIQTVPMVLGAERVTFESRYVEQLSPVELKRLIGGGPSALARFETLRTKTLDAVYANLKSNGTTAQKNYLDRVATSRAQAAQLKDQLANDLMPVPVQNGDLAPGLIDDYELDTIDQVLTAVALVKYKIAPVVTIHLPFGGDNHQDPGFAQETLELQGGVRMVRLVWDLLSTAGLADSTTFASLNTFGRTFESTGGRAHNSGHHVMTLFGPNVKGGVIGGPKQGPHDWVASAFSSTTGRTDGELDVSEDKTFAAAARTLMRATGISAERVEVRLPGTTISAVLR